MIGGLRARRFHAVPMFAGVAGAVLILGTMVGQGGHAKGDSNDDVGGMATYMPGMSMPGMSMPGMDMSGSAPDAGSTGGSMANMPGMPMEAATPNDGSGGSSTVTLKPGAAGQAGGMSVKLTKISHGAATVQMGKDTASLKQGASKKFGDGMTVKAVKVKRDGATLQVTPPQ